MKFIFMLFYFKSGFKTYFLSWDLIPGFSFLFFSETGFELILVFSFISKFHFPPWFSTFLVIFAIFNHFFVNFFYVHFPYMTVVLLKEVVSLFQKFFSLCFQLPSIFVISLIYPLFFVVIRRVHIIMVHISRPQVNLGLRLRCCCCCCS